MNYEKKISSLEKEIERLKAKAEREALIKERIGNLMTDLKSKLAEHDISMDEFIKAHFRVFRRSVQRIEASLAEDDKAKQKDVPKRKKSAGRKKARRSRKKSPVIPAGRYAGLPNDPERIYEVKQRGPRPKVLNDMVKSMGLDEFVSTFRVKDAEDKQPDNDS